MQNREDDSESLKAARVRTLEDLKLAGEAIAQYRNSKWQTLESWAGDLLDEMLGSRRSTEILLQHPNWTVRLTALLLLDDRWDAVPNLAEAFADIILADAVAVVRGLSFRLLVDCVRCQALVELPGRVRHLSPLVLGPVTAKGELGESRSTVLGMLSDIAMMKAADRKRRREELQELAGHLADPLLHDRSLALNSLAHSDPRLRCAALKLFGDYWKPPADFDHICLRMLNEDGDTRVRCTALTTLMMSQTGLEEVVLGPRLAALVQDVMLPLDLRELAYYWLVQLRGSAISEWRSLPRDDAGFAAAIDWSLVRSFSQTTEG